MTTTTPPGWYPEPGHTGSGPAMERWWDGSAWTEYTRTAPVPADAPQVYPGYPGYPGYPQGGGPERGRRTGTVVLALVAALVLIGGIVAGVLVLGKDDGGKKDAGPTASPSHRGKIPGPGPSEGGDGGSDTGGGDGGADGGGTGGDGGDGGDKGGDGKTAVDAYDAISLPVLDGWKGESQDLGAGVSTGDYTCPGTSGGTCSLGGVFSMPAVGVGITAKTPEAAAKQDIAKNAASAYGPDTYGATTSHQQLKAAKITVAGQQGYLVRWKVVTKSGTNGYVESLAFPSPTTKQMVLVRFGFDITDKAPGLDVMDQIAQGIKSDTSHGSGSTGSTGTGV